MDGAFLLQILTARYELLKNAKYLRKCEGADFTIMCVTPKKMVNLDNCSFVHRTVNTATKTFNRPAATRTSQTSQTLTQHNRLLILTTTWAATKAINTTSMAARMEEVPDKCINKSYATFKGTSMKRIRWKHKLVSWLSITCCCVFRLEVSLMLGTFTGDLNQARCQRDSVR